MTVMDAATRVLAQVPNPGAGQPPPFAGGLITLLQWGAWIVFAVCVGGILVGAGKMAMSHRRGQGGGEEAQSVGWPMIAAIIGAAASGIIGALVTL